MLGFGESITYPTNVGFAYASPPGQCSYAAAVNSLCKPTIVSTPGYDANNDAQALRKAMKGLGTDEDAIIEILGSKTSDERQLMKEAFKSNFGRDLVTDLKSEISGNFRDVVCKMMFTRPMLLASELYHAISGAGTDEATVIEILCTASNRELAEIKEAYKEYLALKGKTDPTRNLEKDVMGDFSGDLKCFLVALLQGQREEPNPDAVKSIPQFGIRSVVDMNMVAADCDKLRQAGEEKIGTDEETFITILVKRSIYHIKALDDLYNQQTGHNLCKAIENEFSGNLEKAMVTTVEALINKSLYFAHILHKSMKGVGTNDQMLMFTLVWRSEIDLYDVKDAFQNFYREDLTAWIKDDTSGDYRKMLLKLVSGNCN